MDYLIAPTLFKNKICHLPGIGTLEIVTKSAETDYVKQIINAPHHSILFNAAQDDENIFNEFTALSKLIKSDLEEYRMVSLKGIGDLIKNESGAINFIPLQLNKFFTPTIDAKQRMLEDEQNALLLLEQKLAKVEAPQNSVETSSKKRSWWGWAIALTVAAGGVLAYYIFKNGVNGLGNVRF